MFFENEKWKIMLQKAGRKKRFWLLGFLLLVWLFSLPQPLFQAPLSTVLEDEKGDLLGARIAADGQWRFPEVDSVPKKYAACLIEFEDRRFGWHFGVDPVGITRAVFQNLKAQKVVSGGSTITMQIVRMSRQNPSRSFFEKMVEVWLATRLELRFSKQKLLALYASNAPFGGNVVGLEAATWRYFGKKPSQMTWAEAATMAVLPNSPALIRPGRSPEMLQKKRDRLLERLFEIKKITALELESARAEPLPNAPKTLPQLAPHLLERLRNADCGLRIASDGPKLRDQNGRFRTTLKADLQARLTEILARRQAILRQNGIHNLAACIIDVPSGAVVAYVGNIVGSGAEHGESVDILAAARSSGSILKPYLYALAVESGDILPNALLPDVPMSFGSYRPENFYHNYDGAVGARRALVRSLNVPFVRLLQQFGLEKFHFSLKKLGLTTISQPADHYGLTLILGGAEVNLLEITGAYASMGRSLLTFSNQNSRYDPLDFRPPTLLFSEKTAPSRKEKLVREAPVLSAGAIWTAFEAMQQVERPQSSGEWQIFQASRKIAWKTGTSIGFRDAWAAGVAPDFAVGVWAGNADGEGRAGLIGVESAAPILFEIFENLPSSSRWFDQPMDDFERISVCRASGFRASPICEADTIFCPKSSQKGVICPFHQLLHLDLDEKWQVTASCCQPSEMRHEPFFVLDPVAEHYFKQKNPSYRTPPPFRADCLVFSENEATKTTMRLIQPKSFAQIFVPVELDGRLGKTVFKLAHRDQKAVIFWHLDGQFLGTTRDFHEMALAPEAGRHVLTCIDQAGNRLEQAFEIISKKEKKEGGRGQND